MSGLMLDGVQPSSRTLNSFALCGIFIPIVDFGAYIAIPKAPNPITPV
jgi:hypothetical protein